MWSFQFFWSFSFLLWSLKSDDCKRNNCFRSMHNFVAKLFQLYLCFEKSTWPNLPKTVFFKSLTSKKHKIVIQESTEFTSWYFFRMWIHQSLPNKACQKEFQNLLLTWLCSCPAMSPPLITFCQLILCVWIDFFYFLI